jgi:hypothetical protein
MQFMRIYIFVFLLARPRNTHSQGSIILQYTFGFELEYLL